MTSSDGPGCRRTREGHGCTTSLLVAVVILSVQLTWPATALAEVRHEPLIPTHEDDVRVQYSPEPGDNTSMVLLDAVVGEEVLGPLTLAPDDETGNYTYDLGVHPPGTEISYTVTAWNRTVGQENFSISSVVTVLWHEDMDEAKGLAAELGRPLLIFLMRDGDKDSYPMLMETFTDGTVLNLSAEFVAIKVDVDEDPSLAHDLAVVRTPVTLFLNEDSKEVHRTEGLRRPKAMAADMRYALGTGPRPDEDGTATPPTATYYLVLSFFVILVVVSVIAINARRGRGPA